MLPKNKSCLLYGLFALLVCVSISAIAPSKPLIPRKILFGNPEKAFPRLSPDGKRLAYLAPDDQNVLNIWVRDLDRLDAESFKITSDHSYGIFSFVWQYDNEHILYTQDRDGDENEHLYQTSILSRETRDLTPHEGVKVRILDYNFQYPDEMLIEMNLRDSALFDVYRLNLQTGSSILDTVNDVGVTGWVSDTHLRVRAAHSLTQKGDWLIRIRDHVMDPWREFMTIDAEETESGIIGFSTDDRFCYLLTSLDSDTSRLFKVDLQSGHKEVLAYDRQYDISGIVRHPTTYQIEAIEIEKERLERKILDPLVQLDFDIFQQIDADSVFQVVSRDLKDRTWIVLRISDQSPRSYYVYDRVKGTTKFLFSIQPSLGQYQLATTTPISFPAQDGMEIFGYLTLPNDVEPSHLPTILYVHGGPWLRDSWGFDPVVQWLANRGFAVLQINFRGSAGYGKYYLNAGNREWAGKMQSDLTDGKRWAIEKGYSDPEKVAIFGGSYGGYATLVGLAFTPDEFCCGVDVVGPSNLITLLQTIPPYWLPEMAQTSRRIGNLEMDGEFLKSRSPLFKADQIKKPLLIAQGAQDPRVKQAESDQIVSALRKNNLPVEYLLFPDEGHGFARPENALRFYAACEAFLAKHVGTESEPATQDDQWDMVKK